MSTLLSVETRTLYPKMLAPPSSVTACITVSAKRARVFQDTTGAVPSPANSQIVLVVDRSTSMFATVGLVNKIIEYAVGSAKPEESIAVVSFATDVKVEWAMRSMSAETKEHLRERLLSQPLLKADGCTNLCDALLEGLNQFVPVENCSPLRNLILVTDGVPTVGVKVAEDILEKAREHKMFDGVTISTVAVGTQVDAMLLQKLAWSGTFYTLKSQENLPIALGDCLGGLRSTIAQDCRVWFLQGQEARKIEILNATLQDRKQQESDEEEGSHYLLGNLFHGESRNVLVKIGVEDEDHRPPDSFSFVLSYLCASSGKPETCVHCVSLPPVVPTHEEGIQMLQAPGDPFVRLHLLRLKAAQVYSSLASKPSWQQITELDALKREIKEIGDIGGGVGSPLATLVKSMLYDIDQLVQGIKTAGQEGKLPCQSAVFRLTLSRTLSETTNERRGVSSSGEYEFVPESVLTLRRQASESLSNFLAANNRLL